MPLSLPMANNLKGISDECDSDSLWYDSLGDMVRIDCEGIKLQGIVRTPYTNSKRQLLYQAKSIQF